MRVERMRQAILQGVPLDLAFAKPALPMMPGNPFGPPMYQGMNLRPGGAPPHHMHHHGGPPMSYSNFGGGGGAGGRGGHHAGRGRGLLGEFGSKHWKTTQWMLWCFIRGVSQRCCLYSWVMLDFFLSTCLDFVIGCFQFSSSQLCIIIKSTNFSGAQEIHKLYIWSWIHIWCD